MSQWLVVDGVKHDLREATQRAKIRDLVDLHRAAGISVRTIADVLVGMGDMESILDIYDDPARLEVFAAMLFLCKRKAGDPAFAWADALESSLLDIQIVFEHAGADDDDPKDPSTPEEPESE